MEEEEEEGGRGGGGGKKSLERAETKQFPLVHLVSITVPFRNCFYNRNETHVFDFHP